MPDSAITHAPGVFAPGHLGELTQVVPFELVDEALARAGGRERRLRRLPSRVVVYLLLAGALFESMGWAQVWSRVTASLPDPPRAPAGSSITAAMRRVGSRPVKALFDLVKGPVAVVAAPQVVRFAGRLVAAVDGTQIPLPDTVANKVVFRKPRPGPNGQAGYPMLRLVTLMACGTRSLLDAVFGTDRIGELTYAGRLTDAMGPGMLVLADRNFAATGFIGAVAATGADFLIRAKTHTTALALPVLRRLDDGTFLSRIGGVKVRVIDATITVTVKDPDSNSDPDSDGDGDGDRCEQHLYRLVTNLLDPAEASALDLVRLYHERWEIEISYFELKSTILAGRVLRSRHPDAVAQELWALLVVYQVLRTAMADALLHRPEIDPDRACFTIALNTARDQIIRADRILTGTRVDLVGRIGAAILDRLQPARRPRTHARAIKRAISKYRAKSRNIDRRTHPTSIHFAISPLPPQPDG
ncbi:MAG TPA: IS4 family transposase [Kribbella sp.]|nr:IS4 family transposase [Kribbella sp.]